MRRALPVALCAALAALPAAAGPIAKARSEVLIATVEEVSGTLLSVSPGEHVRHLGSGEPLRGHRTLRTVDGGRARLSFGPGITVLLGPATRLALAPPPAPPLLTDGALRIENRPGDPGGPSTIVATRLAEVHAPGDGRVLVTVTRGTGKLPDTLRVVALRGDVTLVPYQGKVARRLPAGHQVTGAGWVPIARWNVKPLGPAEKADLERLSLPRSDRAQLPGRAKLIPPESLRLDENPIPAKRVFLSRADVPPEGRLVFTGRLLLKRLPPELGEVYVSASKDGGESWERLKWTDGDGAFAYTFWPQDGVEYTIVFGVFERLTNKLFETTGPYPIVFREAFLPALSDFKVCGLSVPEKGGPLTIHSDELTDFKIPFQGTVRSDAPLSRVRVEVSPDAGLRWKDAPIAASVTDEPAAGQFHALFAPVPGGTFQFRVRTVYAKERESIRPHQVLSDWDAPVDVRYLETRSTDRAAGLVRDLEAALRAGDLTKAYALLSPHFRRAGRDFARATGVKLRPGEAAREAGTLQVSVDWERPEPDGRVAAGKAIFLYVRESDFALLDVLGDDPFAAGSPAVAPQGGPPPETVVLAADSTFDFEARRPRPYSPKAIPDDVGFYRDDGQLVIGTHDRRLAALPQTSLAEVGAVDRRALEYRAQLIPAAGAVYYLKTKEGAHVALQILETPELDSRAPRLKLSFRFLEK